MLSGQSGETSLTTSKASAGLIAYHSPFHDTVNLDKYLVVGGVPGVHKLVTTRSNGLIIEDRQEGRTRFVPVRQQQVTPLGTISIYTDTEEGTILLGDVFQKMLDQYESLPPVSLQSSSADLRTYFTSILPEHDQDRVHINDIKKCIKWFSFMQEKGIFEEIRNAATEAVVPGTTDQQESASETPVDAAEDTQDADAAKS